MLLLIQVKTNRLSEGFTLIEVVMSLAALIVGVVALWGLHMSALKVDFRINLETKASLRANEKLEQLRSAALTNFADPMLANGADEPDSIFTRTWTVTMVSNWQKNILVTVSWFERVRIPDANNVRVPTNVPRSVQLTTILVNFN